VLSRVADSLYWTARYVERAEAVTRLVHVNFHGMLDTPVADHDSAWWNLLAITGHSARYEDHYDRVAMSAVTEFLLWHPANPDAVVTSIVRARENARGVREQLTSEIWEHLNRLYLFVRDARREAVLRAPHNFLARIREASQSFQGIARATMPHEEPYEFMQLGAYLERAGQTARIVNVHYGAIERLPPGADATLRLTALLKSCGAFEAFRRQRRARLRPAAVAQYLLLDAAFPRTVRFGVDAALAAVVTVASEGTPHRVLGRLAADLTFADGPRMCARPLEETLDPLIQRLREVDEEVTRVYFNTQALVADPPAAGAAEQQQQQ
jgi:uncharacterized alpha-E superfamily protein